MIRHRPYEIYHEGEKGRIILLEKKGEVEDHFDPEIVTEEWLVLSEMKDGTCFVWTLVLSN